MTDEMKRFKEEFKSELIDAFNQSLHSKRSIDDDKHDLHHRFVEAMIAKEERHRERAEKIKTQVYGWGIIAAFSGIGTAVYHFFIKNANQ